MSEPNSKSLVDKIEKFIKKYDENHHEIELEYNKELKQSLSKSELKDHTSEECDKLIEVLNHALEVVEDKVSHTLIAVKDSLKQAKIDALERKLMYCKCQQVPLRPEHKRSFGDEKKNDSGICSSEKRLVDSGISNTSPRDSSVMSDPGVAPVVQPTDASEDGTDTGENDTGKEQSE